MRAADRTFEPPEHYRENRMQHAAEFKMRNAQGPPLANVTRRNDHDRARRESPTRARDLKADLAETTAGIIAKCGDPARVLEFYYWSREPGLSSLIRAFLALPATTRTALGAFLTNTPDPQLVSIRAEKRGRLTFSLPRAAKAKKTRR
jgi:hypothetical protein